MTTTTEEQTMNTITESANAPFFRAEIQSKPGARWASLGAKLTPADAAWLLNDAMQLQGFRYSELADHRADLADGHVLTAENGTAFRLTQVVPARHAAEVSA